MTIEETELKFKETRAALDALQREAAELPAAIAAAAQAGEVEKVTKLQERQARLKSEIFVASASSRREQIAAFQARRDDADERARLAAESRSELLPKLQEEERRLVARLHELPIELQRAHNAVNEPQKESVELGEKIRKCEEDLQAFLKRESGAEQAAAAAAPTSGKRELVGFADR